MLLFDSSRINNLQGVLKKHATWKTTRDHLAGILKRIKCPPIKTNMSKNNEMPINFST